MADGSDSLDKNSRMKLRANINEQYEHWNPEAQKKIKSYMKELKSGSGSTYSKWPNRNLSPNDIDF